MNIKVTINRGKGNVESLFGLATRETTSFFFVEAPAHNVAEWFAKDSAHVHCMVMTNIQAIAQA